QLSVAIDSDTNNPLRVTGDDYYSKSFNDHSLLNTQTACIESQSLTARFDQTGKNSFALGYSLSDTKCVSDGVTVRPTTEDSISEISLWSMVIAVVLAAG
ncbi:hypothetical protein PFISCL1PPCAC_18960, partial [Pristionchus fissidentatus]